LPKASAIIVAVVHDKYAEMGPARITEKLLPGGVFADVKSAYDPDQVRATGAHLWRL
jgi:UDP-N-acetyl-D-galactosamine dehydrogenase